MKNLAMYAGAAAGVVLLIILTLAALEVARRNFALDPVARLAGYVPTPVPPPIA